MTEYHLHTAPLRFIDYHPSETCTCVTETGLQACATRDQRHGTFNPCFLSSIPRCGHEGDGNYSKKNHLQTICRVHAFKQSLMIFADELANSAKDIGFRTNQHLIIVVRNPVSLAELTSSSAKIISLRLPAECMSHHPCLARNEVHRLKIRYHFDNEGIEIEVGLRSRSFLTRFSSLFIVAISFRALIPAPQTRFPM